MITFHLMNISRGENIRKMKIESFNKVLNHKKYRKVIETIDNILDQKKDIIIAIDGNCGAGKTTLGNFLAEYYQASLFHMDDFFLQKYQRTKKRYQSPGGNVDYERFYDSVIQPLLHRRDVNYQRFNCQEMELEKNSVVMAYHAINIIEGTYSMHPYFEHYYDLCIVLRINDDEQERRIRKRNGIKQLDMFKNKWIPLEKHYFSVFDIFGQADILLDEEK